MHDIDLIPREHVERRRVRRWLMRIAALLAAIVLASALGRGALAFGLARERPAVQLSRQAEQAAAAQRSRLAELGVRKAALEGRLAALRRLQDDAAWDLALRSVDAAYSPRIWLDRLSIGRGAADSTPAPLLVELRGHAVDHAAVTDFLHRLAEQPGVNGARLLDTGMRHYSMADVVDFGISTRVLVSGPVRP